MNHGLYIAFAGLKSRAQAMDVATNNLANLNVAGFKKDRVYYNIFNKVNDVSSNELERALGDSLVAQETTVDFSMGDLVRTGNPLHLALSEEGFFAVETPQGIRYTRSGALQLNDRREIANSQGFPLLGQTRPIVVPEGQIQISPSGTVSVENAVVGQLKVVHFDDLSQLKKEGSSLFMAPQGLREREPLALNVQQGYLEQANVNPVQGIAEMISLMRSFEMLSLTVRSMIDQVNRNVTNDVGRV